MQKDQKKLETGKNARTVMDGAELKMMRRIMKFEPREMRATLALPGAKPIPRRTYQDYEAGKRRIPTKLATRIREVFAKDQEFMAGINDRIDAAEKGRKKR